MVMFRDDKKWAERLAATCVQAALPGVTVRQHDDGTRQRQKVHDLDLSYGDGFPFGAMEVTTDTDPELIKFWNAHEKWLNDCDGRWIAPKRVGLVGGWIIYVRPD